MAAFVINEWLWADSSGVNGLPAQRAAFEFIVKLVGSNHSIVIIEGSAFDRKAWNLCKNTNPVIVQRIAAFYVVEVRQNSDRCVILKPNQVAALPDGLAAATKADDHYLLQAQLSVRGSVLVTTDAPLREAARNAGLECLTREDFLVLNF